MGVAPSFGERIRALRLATAVSERPHLSGTRWVTDGHLSVNGLAKLADVNPAYVQHIEAGRRQRPSVPVVLRFARALGCSELETAELLVSAGHWPWPDVDDATTTLLVAVGCAIACGDYRPHSTPCESGGQADQSVHEQISVRVMS